MSKIYYIDKDCVIPRIKNKRNKSKLWKYGYDAEHDIVIISKDGTLGEVYNIQGLRVGLPQAPKDLRFRRNG